MVFNAKDGISDFLSISNYLNPVIIKYLESLLKHVNDQ